MPMYYQDDADQRDARIIELEAALRATRRWNLADGPCWCELKRANVVKKIHSTGCKLARRALSLPSIETLPTKCAGKLHDAATAALKWFNDEIEIGSTPEMDDIANQLRAALRAAEGGE